VATVRRAPACDGESALTRSIHGGGAVLVGDANDAEHGPEAHFGLWILGHGATRDLGDVGPELASPIGHSLWRPLTVVLMLARAVLGIGHRGAGTRVAAPVGRDTHTTVEALDNARGRAHLDGLSAQLEGNAVQAVVELDVVVDVGTRLLALRKLEAERWQRFHARPVERLERLAPRAWQFLEAPCVELLEQLSDGAIELGEREEHAIAQTRENPALRDEHTRFDLGLAFWACGAEPG